MKGEGLCSPSRGQSLPSWPLTRRRAGSRENSVSENGGQMQPHHLQFPPPPPARQQHPLTPFS